MEYRRSGAYTYTISDSQACTSANSVIINEPTCGNITPDAQTVDVKCNGGQNGSITVTPIGGKLPYTYKWSNGATTAKLSNLSAGIYTVTVTDSLACSVVNTLTVRQPTPLAPTTTKTDLTVVGTSTGEIKLNVAGGTPFYIVQMFLGALSLEPSSGTPPQYIYSNLAKGAYQYMVRDVNGCSTTGSVTINDPNCPTMFVADQNTAVSCKGEQTGRLVLTPSGGIPPYRYKWNVATIGNTPTANNLPAGIYAVTVTDSVGCFITKTYAVSEPDSLLSSTTLRHTSTINGNDGRITVNVTGGTPPYIVLSGLLTAIRTNPTTFVFDSLRKGTYTYLVTDWRGCTTTRTVIINDPNCSITAQINIIKPISCFGASDGALNVVVQNAQTPQYKWSPNLGNTSNPTGLAPNTYKLTVTDANSCSATAEITLTQPAQITASLVGDTAICRGQTSPLKFSVQNAAVFNLTYTNGVDTLRSTTLTATVTPTNTTTYRLLSVQSGACSGLVLANNSAVVTVTTPSVLTGLKAEKDSVCIGLDIRLRVDSVNAQNYIWQTPLGDRTTTTSELIITNATTANSGNYSVKTNQNGCPSAVTTPVNVRVLNKPTEKANAGLDKVECNQTNTILNASAIVNQGLTGRWTALNNAVIVNPTGNSTGVTNLTEGVNRFVWVLNNAVCGEISRDTVAVSVPNKLELDAPRQINLDGKLSTVFVNIRELLKNKFIDPTLDSVKITKIPAEAKAVVQNNGIYFDRNNLLDAQTIEIEFEICSKICPTICSKGKIIVTLQTVVDDTQFSVPKVFATTNSTGVSMEINGANLYVENEVLIVDRWGKTVFGPKAYKNNDAKQSWDGKANGKPLPSGAYYYFVNYKDANVLKTQRGIIYLVEE